MGVIALALVVGGKHATFVVDNWVIFAAAVAIALGTYVGGWRIVQHGRPPSVGPRPPGRRRGADIGGVPALARG